MTSLTIPPIARLRGTEIEFCGWLGQAAPGEVFEYHRGFLALDIQPLPDGLPERERADLANVGKRAYWAAERGYVHLVQRRLARDLFSYLAIARPREARPLPFLILHPEEAA